MKKQLIIYSACLIGLAILTVVAVTVSQSLDAGSALRKLGRGDRDFEEARQQLLLTSTDATEALLDFVSDADNSLRARLQGIRILGDIAKNQKVLNGAHRLSLLVESNEPALQLAALQALEHFSTIEGRKPVESLFHQARDTALFQQSFRTLESGVIRLQARCTHALQSLDTVVIDSCIHLVDDYPLGKGQLYPLFAEYYQKKGDAMQASAFYRELGLVKKWWVMGGFENQRMSGFDKDFGPEGRPFNPEDRFPIDDKDSAGWFRLQHIPFDGWIDIKNLFVKQQYSMAYFFTYLNSPSAREALLYLGSDDGVKIWLNDSLVYVHKVNRGVIPDDDVVRLSLREGINTLLIKVAQDVGGWGLMCRLADFDGKALSDIRYSFDGERFETPTEKILELRLAGGDSLRLARTLESERIAEGMGADADLLRIIGDASEDPDKRLEAVALLERLNTALFTRDGERELMDLCTRLLEAAPASELLQAGLGALANMGSLKTLDLGLAARRTEVPRTVYWGNMLVTQVARRKVMDLGDPNQEDRNRVRRAMSDVAALDPADAWTQERLAYHYTFEGDTAATARWLPPVRMPSTWVLGAAVFKDSAEAVAYATGSRRPDPANFLAGKDAIAIGAWVTLDVPLEAQSGQGAFYREVRIPGKNEYSAFLTTVTSTKPGKAYLRMGMPQWHAVYFNGKLLAESPSMLFSRYNLASHYPWQEVLFDHEDHVVELRAGENEILVVFPRDPVQPGWPRFFRLTFAGEDGRNLVFKGNEIQW